MDIAIPLFDRFTALDAIGPYEVLSRLPGYRVTFVAEYPGVRLTDNGMLGLVAEKPFADMPHPEIVVVPGGIGTRAMMHDAVLVDWVRGAHATSQFTCSVCTGSLVLGAAGILEGLEATTHWAAMELLGSTGAIPTSRRVVEQGKVITAAGVSAGIDMALTLAAHVAGDAVAQAIQLGIEYDPQPPFDSGSLEKAPQEAIDLCKRVERAVDE
ncbi:MAG TPA: DJ-1/PfpI family protein, partial [Solirubrobacteraceae bacterium]